MSKRILIVEDDDNVRDTIELLLSSNGFKVFTCSTGKDIFNTLKSTEPYLVLLDVLLGDIDGREICKAVKSHPETAHIPVIIVSSVYNIYNIIMDEKANDVIPKPFTEDILLSRIQRQLSNAS